MQTLAGWSVSDFFCYDDTKGVNMRSMATEHHFIPSTIETWPLTPNKKSRAVLGGVFFFRYNWPLGYNVCTFHKNPMGPPQPKV